MYFTDKGIEELDERRGEDEVTMAWLAERLRDFVDLNPDFEVAIDRLATWLARLDNEEELLYRTSCGACARPPAPQPVAPWCPCRRVWAASTPLMHAICLDFTGMRYIV